MAKVNSLLRKANRRQGSSISESSTIGLDKAVQIMEIQTMTFFLSAHQVLKDDFNFGAADLIKFQQLLQIRMEINRIKK